MLWFALPLLLGCSRHTNLVNAKPFSFAMCKMTPSRLQCFPCFGFCLLFLVCFFLRRPDGSVGMALVLPALTDCRWWFESLLVHSGVSSATRRKATGADHKKSCFLFVLFLVCSVVFLVWFLFLFHCMTTASRTVYWSFISTTFAAHHQQNGAIICLN